MNNEEGLKEFWSKKVTGNWCHFHDKMSKDKTERTKKLFKENLLEQINCKGLRTLDWGCGGGVLAEEMIKYGSVVLADISERSLKKAGELTGDRCKTVLLPEKLENLKGLPKEIQMIYCYSVIQHFPSYNYWTNVTKAWRKMKPEYIAGRSKFSNKIIEAEEYKKSRNFLNALILTKKDLLNRFPEYRLIYWNQMKNKKHPYLDGFFILERK
jgi:2-polyprenyl-3-methyl-5-hydroxy-6-metoxy-1,4-benzoquinol methylase